ncbi:MAG: hypothetical protein AB9891_01645 [Anaerolineaceae bacterium]
MQNSKIAMEELHQSMVSLLKPEFAAFRGEVETLQKRLKQVEALSNPLPEDVQRLQKDLKTLIKKIMLMDQESGSLRADLKNPEKVTDLIKLGLHPALEQSIADDPYHYGEAIAPVISPAIRNQIRNSRDEMVAALSPIIGQTISKAVADAFEDFRRRIDAQMKQNLNFQGQVRRFFARMRGVSDADMLIREALPYDITHVFLIQRQSGLLIKQVSLNADRQDSDLISAMLTAVRDFAGDAFGQEGRELEEIQYGEAHILLRTGQYAYAAVVVEGTAPSGYAALMGRVVNELNIEHEAVLRRFKGDMKKLPDFGHELYPLLHPGAEEMTLQTVAEQLNPGQKKLLGFGGCAVVGLLALLVFGCIFASRLLPVAFPAPTATVAVPTLTPSPTYTPVSPTATASPTPTVPTATVLPSSTPESFYGVMTGNVWIRENPDPASPANQVVIPINTKVELKAISGKWVKIAWVTEFGDLEGWVPVDFVGMPFGVPERIVTPVE